jgi:hypothetical protein
MSHPLSGRRLLCATLGAIAEWVIDASRDSPLVMRSQGSSVFSTGTYDSVTSYNDVDDDGLPEVEFFYIVHLG